MCSQIDSTVAVTTCSDCVWEWSEPVNVCDSSYSQWSSNTLKTYQELCFFHTFSACPSSLSSCLFTLVQITSFSSIVKCPAAADNPQMFALHHCANSPLKLKELKAISKKVVPQFANRPFSQRTWWESTGVNNEVNDGWIPCCFDLDFWSLVLSMLAITVTCIELSHR